MKFPVKLLAALAFLAGIGNSQAAVSDGKVDWEAASTDTGFSVRVWPHREGIHPGTVAKVHSANTSGFLRRATDWQRYRVRRDLESDVAQTNASFSFRDGDPNLILVKPQNYTVDRKQVLTSWPTAAHDHYLALFVDNMGFGPSRLLPLPPPREFHFTEMETGLQRTVRISNVQLLGLVMRPTPVVYLEGSAEPAQTHNVLLPAEMHLFKGPAATNDFSATSLTNFGKLTLAAPPKANFSAEIPRVSEAPNPPHSRSISVASVRKSQSRPAYFPARELSARETEAVKLMKAGEDLVWIEEGRKRSLLGSIRAGQICLDCHSVREGELLGALIYHVTFVDGKGAPAVGGE